MTEKGILSATAIKYNNATLLKFNNRRVMVETTKSGDFLLYFKRLLKEGETIDGRSGSASGEYVNKKIITTVVKISREAAECLYYALSEELKPKQSNPLHP